MRSASVKLLPSLETLSAAGGISRFTLDQADLGQVLTARTGQTTVAGGAGDDVLRAHETGSTLRGGDGADVFLPEVVSGWVQIEDFTPGEDPIDFSDLPGRGFGFDDLEISRRPAGTWIDTGAGHLLLEDLRPGQIDADDFLF